MKGASYRITLRIDLTHRDGESNTGGAILNGEVIRLDGAFRLP